MGTLATPVTINGTVCRNCYDVDWARKAEADDIKKRHAEAAKKAKQALEPASFDNQPVTTFGGSLGDGKISAADSAPVAPPLPDTPGQSVNLFV